MESPLNEEDTSARAAARARFLLSIAPAPSTERTAFLFGGTGALAKPGGSGSTAFNAGDGAHVRRYAAHIEASAKAVLDFVSDGSLVLEELTAMIAGREARLAARAAALAAVPRCLERASADPTLVQWTIAGVAGAVRGLGGHVLGDAGGCRLTTRAAAMKEFEGLLVALRGIIKAEVG
jgi:hypothetical protein